LYRCGSSIFDVLIFGVINLEARFDSPIYITRPLLPDKNVIVRKLDEIVDSKKVTNIGDQHMELENALKRYLEIEHITLFNNGTMALLLGIKALGLQGEVITTPFTFPATVQALDWNQLTPVFCDIEPHSLNIDPARIESLITERTSAILAVHVFGNPCDVHQIQKIADRYGLKVIYDAAHAFGSRIDETPIGSYGDMTMFSFHATKLFNTIEGGALTYRDSELAPKLNLLKNFGIANEEQVVLSGLNGKMNEIQAGIGLEVLRLVNEERSKRLEILNVYMDELRDVPGVKIVTKQNNLRSSLQYFVVRIVEDSFGKSRDWLYEELKKFNIYSRKYFYPLCSDFPWYKHLESTSVANLKVAHRISSEVLCLPFYGELGCESVRKICRIIRQLQAM